MNKIFLTCAVLISLHISFAQTNSLNFPKDAAPVRGFYKTYEEYLSNSPSIKIDFTTTLFRLSKKDPMIIGAKYEIADSLDDLGEIWGFCDGTDIFVQTRTIFDDYYWKLQCRGPNPYFYEKRKSVFIGPSVIGLIGTAASLAIPADCDLMLIDHEGRKQYTSRHQISKLLKDNAILFSSFKSERDLYDSVARQYIEAYNVAKMNK